MDCHSPFSHVKHKSYIVCFLTNNLITQKDDSLSMSMRIFHKLFHDLIDILIFIPNREHIDMIIVVYLLKADTRFPASPHIRLQRIVS